MEEPFLSCVLHYDGSGTPALARKTASILPGKSFQLADTSEKTFLAGGFPGLTPRSGCTLSPTLQLNCDLSDLSDNELNQIAQAELNRYNSSTYRSYTRELDNRVAVMAGKPSLLNGFLDTYGGIVHAEPFLLKGYDGDYTTIDDLHIESRENGYRLRYTVRLPIDAEKCTYCGLCGPACPEDCLSENLFLDLSDCSFCNKCIEACPSGAIDLYRAEKKSLDIPAIILLDDCKIELPEDQSRIFTGNSLEPFLSTLVPLQVDETVSCNPYICQYIPRLDAGCTACVDACPQDAVSKTDEGILINHERCAECGSCISSCPTGAMQYEPFDDQCFVEWFKKVKIQKNCFIIIGKEKQLHALWWKRNLPDNETFLFLEHPNFRTLTSMHLVFLLSMGAGKVILLDEPDSIASHPVAREIQFTNTVFSSLYGVDEGVAVATRQNLSGILAEASTSPTPLLYSNFSFTNRREKLGSILKYLINNATAANDKITTLTGRAFEAYGSVICDVEKCTHCGACLNDCRIGALTTDDEKLSLNHLGINCIQCNVCVHVCPEEALELQQGLQLASAFFVPRELTQAEPVVCPECNKAFGTKKSFDRVMAKLKTHSSFRPENNFFEYCEKCRVVKLFESQQQ